MKKIIAIGYLLLSCAAEAGNTGYISLAGKRLQIITDATTPRTFVYDVTVHDSGCTNTGAVLRMDSSNTVASEMYSTLLVAKSTNKEVEIVTNGCLFNIPIIIAIYLND